VGGPGLVQGRREAGQRRLDRVRTVADELDQVDALHLLARILREVGGDALPDGILLGESQHLGVHRLDRGRPEGHERPCVAQGRVEAVVAEVHQRHVARQRQDVERRLREEAQRPLRAAQHGVEVEAAVRAAQMGEVVAGEAAVQRRERFVDQRGVLALKLVHLPVDGPREVLPGLRGREPVVVEGFGVPDRPVGQRRGEGAHVVAGLAVEAGALAAGVGRDHPADGGAVRGRQFGGEEQAVLGQGRVELVLHHTRLDPRRAAHRVDGEDAVHVPREINHDPVREGLAVGPGPAAAGGDPHRGEPLLGEQGRDAHEVVPVARESDGLRRDLVDRIVRGEHGAVGLGHRQVAREAPRAQLGAEGRGQGRHPGAGGEARDHGGQAGSAAGSAARRTCRPKASIVSAPTSRMPPTMRSGAVNPPERSRTRPIR